MAVETKIFCHVDYEDTPYRFKLPIAPTEVRLRDLKARLALGRPCHKFFFKSPDEEVGIVKEEISDDDARLPIFNGCIYSYVVTADGSAVSDGSGSQVTEVSGMVGSSGAVIGRTGHNNQAFSSRSHHQQHSNHHNAYNSRNRRNYGNGQFASRTNGRSMRPDDDYDDDTTTCTESESAISSRCSRRGRGYGAARCPPDCDCNDSSSVFTSDVDSTSFVDSDDEDDDEDDDIGVDESASRVSATTADTSVSRIHESRRRRRHQRRTMPMLSNDSSVSSLSDSSMSMNVITVNLNLEPQDAFLGISLIGEPSGGIYVQQIVDGGTVAADGRIEAGDRILQVNDISFERMKNDDAVNLLRAAAQSHQAIKLVVLKTWLDKAPRFAIPRSEPVRPIDPGAWVAHTEAARAAGEYPVRPPSSATVVSNSSSIQSSVTDSERLLSMDKMILRYETTDMLTVTKSMAAYDSGLDIKERDWLKIKIPDAFLGSDVVDWLFAHVQGFNERKEAKKYASLMMKEGYIRHTLSKNSFSEQCYYVFGDMINLADGMGRMRLVDDEDCDSSDRDTLITVRDGRGTVTGSNAGSPWHQQRHQVAPAAYADPPPGPGFLPWGQDAVHYGTIFGPTSGSAEGLRNQHQSNSRSGGSSCSDPDRSQLTGPLPISSFKPQIGTPPLISSLGASHLPPNAMQHLYQNEMSQNQYSEPNYATAVIPNESSKLST